MASKDEAAAALELRPSHPATTKDISQPFIPFAGVGSSVSSTAPHTVPQRTLTSDSLDSCDLIRKVYGITDAAPAPGGMPGPGYFPVRLLMYDLSHGWAKILSPLLLCRCIETVPHTSILAYGYEFFWGGGIQKMEHHQFVEQTGQKPVGSVLLGYTQFTDDLFHDWIENVRPQYTEQTYDILNKNCNHFTQACSMFLVGEDIPEPIRDAPKAVQSSCQGKCLLAWCALSPSKKRSFALGARWIGALIGLSTLASMSRHDECPAAPGDDASINFTLFIFAFEIAWASFLSYALGWAFYRRKVLCLLRLEFVMTILLLILSFSSAVSLSSFHVASHRFFPHECTYTNSNYAKLSAGVAFSWIHCLLLPVMLFLQVYPLAKQLAEDHTGVGGFTKVPGDP